MSRLSFRERLTLLTAAGIALVLVVGSAATYLVMRSQLRGQIDESLRRQSGAVEIKRAVLPKPSLSRRGTLKQRAQGTGSATPQRRAVLTKIVPPEQEFGNAPSFYQLIDSQGRAVKPDAGDALGPPLTLPVSQRMVEVARTGKGAYYTDVEVRGPACECSSDRPDPGGLSSPPAR